jgi:hypothetical protein
MIAHGGLLTSINYSIKISFPVSCQFMMFNQTKNFPVISEVDIEREGINEAVN